MERYIDGHYGSVTHILGARTARVVIVDNASGDGSSDQISDWIETNGDPRVQLVRSEINGGFSAGHNIGMSAAPGADFYLILNSDTLLRPGFFEVLLDAAKANPHAGLIAPQLEYEDGTAQISTFRFATPISELIRGASTRQVTQLLARYDVPLGLYPDPAQIEWASFACILLRAEMVQAIGPMDEGYFLYFEDEEYALRANRAGWAVIYEPQAHAVHFRGGSGPVKSLQAAKKRLPNYYYRSRTRFMRQVGGVSGPLRANLFWCLGRLIAQSRRLVGKPVPPIHESEWQDIWTGLIHPLKPDPRSPQGKNYDIPT